jgi:3-phosphoinositide dependent protein kinase-1
MISGRFAFQGLSEYLTWQKIKSLDYTFPDGFDEDAMDLVRRLLVRDPTQRLGAGSPDSAHSYAALRTHSFFASVSWETLWTDPAPPLEAGLVKKEVPAGDEVEGGQWDNVGEMWDRLVGGNADVVSGSGEVEVAGDGMGWAGDGEGTMLHSFKPRRAGGKYAEEGPTGEAPDYLVWQSRTTCEGRAMPGLEEDLEETQTVVGENDAALPEMQMCPPPIPQTGAEPLSPSKISPVPTETIPPAISIHVPGVNASGSGSSSSDGSPVDGVAADLNVNMRIEPDKEAKLKPSLSRGRNRAQTPVQGNGPCSNADWCVVTPELSR